MQNELIDVVRLQKEHGGILEAIGSLLNEFDKTTLANAEEIAKIKDHLTDLQDYLEAHIDFEEHEVLPKVTRYAVSILRKGLVLEHEDISAFISEQIKKIQELVVDPSDKVGLDIFQAKFREVMQEIHFMVENHAQKQEVILELIERVLSEDA
jgi:hemerythrin-like domain-containing protein